MIIQIIEIRQEEVQVVIKLMMIIKLIKVHLLKINLQGD